VTLIEAGGYGLLGGILPEMLALYNLRHVEKGGKPQWVGSWFYWVVTAVMVVLGAGTPVLYQQVGVNINELMAIHLGMATPILIATMTKEKPKLN